VKYVAPIYSDTTWAALPPEEAFINQPARVVLAGLTAGRAICVPYGAGSGGAWRSLTVTQVTLTCARFSIGAGPHEW
jgi:hypothetical protein